MNKGTEAVLAEIKRAAHHAKTVHDWGADENNFHAVMTPDVALQLVAALELAQQQLTDSNRFRDAWKRLAKQNIREREKEIDEHLAALDRIAELEASKLSVKLPDLANDEFWLRFDGRIIFREETYRSAVYRAIEAAGGEVKSE